MYNEYTFLKVIDKNQLPPIFMKDKEYREN